MSNLAILVPTLGRPRSIRPLLDSVEFATDVSHAVYFVPDPDDEDTKKAIAKAGGRVICELAGNYMAKINAAAQLTDEPLLFLGADDIRFHPGWFEAANAKMTDEIGVVGTNDLGSPRVMAGEHATHFLVARWYAERGTVDEQGKVMHDGYWHQYADDELIATAKARGAYAMALDSHVEHLHPFWGKGENDETYRRSYAQGRPDFKRFRRRSRLWTSLSV